MDRAQLRFRKAVPGECRPGPLDVEVFQMLGLETRYEKGDAIADSNQRWTKRAFEISVRARPSVGRVRLSVGMRDSRAFELAVLNPFRGFDL